MKRLGIKLLVAAVLVCALSLGSFAQKTSFPGVRSKTRSPNGRYVISNEDYVDRQPAHSLTLTEPKSGTHYHIYDYGRGVDVLWSPRSNAFVVNDHEGSDSAKPFLFFLPWQDSRIDLWEKLIPFLKSHGEGHFALEHHVYFIVERWLNDHEFICKFWGYGAVEVEGFTKYYIYDMQSGFRHVRRSAAR